MAKPNIKESYFSAIAKAPVIDAKPINKTKNISSTIFENNTANASAVFSEISNFSKRILEFR
ncbi:MAG: hypothetical protein U9R32_10290 [Bacteroidota bacterium]|nr:hypothetical protein [Bacteroidota bacterium]